MERPTRQALHAYWQLVDDMASCEEIGLGLTDDQVIEILQGAGKSRGEFSEDWIDKREQIDERRRDRHLY